MGDASALPVFSNVTIMLTGHAIGESRISSNFSAASMVAFMPLSYLLMVLRDTPSAIASSPREMFFDSRSDRSVSLSISTYRPPGAAYTKGGTSSMKKSWTVSRFTQGIPYRRYTAPVSSGWSLVCSPMMMGEPLNSTASRRISWEVSSARPSMFDRTLRRSRFYPFEPPRQSFEVEYRTSPRE